MGSSKKLLPIGLSDFKQVIEGNYTYVDKSLLIQELMLKGGAVALIPRPRRFGKTLNLSMLRYFFEKTEQDNRHLFQSLKIWQDEACRALQGQFPVIFMTLKDIKHDTWDLTSTALKGLISRAFQAHPYLLEGSVLNGREQQQYQAIVYEQGDQTLYEQSLYLLTQWLYRYHKKRVVLLIDEYDAPAHTAYVKGFYLELMTFLRNWLSGGLKDNPALEKGVLTGILRVAKESIFSGLNNVSTFTILNEGFQDKFGLTENEVQLLLKEYNLLDRWEDIKKWYNGYRIGSFEGIFNPWSVLKCIDNQGALASYWINTSENALLRQLMTQGADDFKADLEKLMKGGSVEQTIEEGLVFTDLPTKIETVWSLLLFSGYLSLTKPPILGATCHLRIPNAELKTIYESIVTTWFKDTIRATNYDLLLKSLMQGDIETFSHIFQEFLLTSFSYFDIPAEAPEKIYHAFVLGLLLGVKDRYEVKSNRESGYGRYDVMLIPKNPGELGIVLEFKKIGPFEKIDLETAVNSALQQIEKRKYDVELKERGVSRILHVGLAFQGKEVVIRSKPSSLS